MNIEIERRFLIDDNYMRINIFSIFTKKFKLISAEKIIQYYFKNNTKEISQRIRDEFFEGTKKHQYTLNIKSNIDDISRYEFEKHISKDDFLFFSKKFCNKVLTKYRFIAKINKNEWEINYLPDNKLILAEIELKNKNKELVIPFDYKKEVTNDKNYLAENLAINIESDKFNK